MPNELDHIKAANHNQEVIEALLPRLNDFADWITIIAFYKALHIVEAVFATGKEPSMRHGIDHNMRAQILKTTNKYKHIWANYRPLYNASMVARYLEDPSCNFNVYLTPQQVRNSILNDHLHRIENSAKKFLTQFDRLVLVGALPK
jgi:hypothetical protein